MFTAVIFVIEMMSIAEVARWVFDRWCKPAKPAAGNEVTGILFGAISLVYSLILAFVIVAVWEDYNDTIKTIEAETDKLNSILSHSSTLPDKLRTDFGKAMYAYCDQVINQEWKMQHQETDQPSAIPALRLRLLTTEPASKIQERVFASVDADLSAISDLHRKRLQHTHSQMPSLIWPILGTGTVLVTLFAFFLDIPSITRRRIYLGFLVASLSMCMFLVYRLDRPFDTNNGLSNEPYRKIQLEIKSYLPTLVAAQLQ
jgi:hypothetical protein